MGPRDAAAAQQVLYGSDPGANLQSMLLTTQLPFTLTSVMWLMMSLSE
jgi:hypothetical protein